MSKFNNINKFKKTPSFNDNTVIKRDTEKYSSNFMSVIKALPLNEYESDHSLNSCLKNEESEEILQHNSSILSSHFQDFNNSRLEQNKHQRSKEAVLRDITQNIHKEIDLKQNEADPLLNSSIQLDEPKDVTPENFNPYKRIKKSSTFDKTKHPELKSLGKSYFKIFKIFIHMCKKGLFYYS